jgi:hypothetical protein
MTAPSPGCFATIPVYADSTGKQVIPGNAVSVGDFDPIADSEARKRVLDERERQLNEKQFELIEWDAALHELADSLTTRGDALAAEKAEFKRTVADTARAYKKSQKDSLELKKQREALNAEPITHPPGFADEGELQAQKEPNHQYLEPNPEPVKPQPPDVPELIEDADGDPGAVLPQAPVPPSDRHYDPNPDPVSHLNLSTLVEDQ